jgi:hypothetical protein
MQGIDASQLKLRNDVCVWGGPRSRSVVLLRLEKSIEDGAFAGSDRQKINEEINNFAPPRLSVCSSNERGCFMWLKHRAWQGRETCAKFCAENADGTYFEDLGTAIVSEVTPCSLVEV